MNGKTKIETNMVLAGQLPETQLFMIKGIGVRLYNTSREVYENFKYAASIQFLIGSKEYFFENCGECMPPHIEDINASDEEKFHAFYPLELPLLLIELQNFCATIYWKEEFNPDGIIQVILDGELYRRYK
jgi:hypothetical protein